MALGSNLFSAQEQAHEALNETVCAPGFRCISKVSKFGMGHDGIVDPTRGANMAGNDESLYEEGCPAIGSMVSGRCENTGQGGECFSSTRYSIQSCSTTNSCLCVRPTTAHGSGDLRNVSAKVEAGDEVQSGSFLTEASGNCQSCAAYDANKAQCDECSNCEFTTKPVIAKDGDGNDYVRKQLGCWTGTSEAQRMATKYELAKGRTLVERELRIVPHYWRWDPDDSAKFRMPYEEGGERLSKSEWLEKYRHDAPKVQQLMDLMIMRMLRGTSSTHAWVGNDADEVALKCGTATDMGDGIAGKLEKFLAIERACKKVQDTAASLAPGGAKFSSGSGGAECGAFGSDPARGVHSCGCHQVDPSRPSSECAALNCYGGDGAVNAAVKAMKRRLEQCAAQAHSPSRVGPAKVPPKADLLVPPGADTGSAPKVAVGGEAADAGTARAAGARFL